MDTRTDVVGPNENVFGVVELTPEDGYHVGTIVTVYGTGDAGG